MEVNLLWVLILSQINGTKFWNSKKWMSSNMLNNMSGLSISSLLFCWEPTICLCVRKRKGETTRDVHIFELAI